MSLGDRARLSVLGRAAYARLLLSLIAIVPLWLAIVWAVALP